MEFVEAQQPSVARERNRGELDRILAGMLAKLHLLPERVHALVHVEHEFVEMGAAFPLHRARLEKQVHQHGLAASDIAVDVEALDRLGFFLVIGEHPAER